MNKSPLTNILTTALGLSALASLALCYFLIKYTHDARALKMEAINAARKQQFILSMGNDIMEYSKKNPAILPIIQSVTAPNPNAAPAKSAK